MPSIGTAKIKSAPGESVPAVPSRTAVVTAMVQPGALPAMPITTDSKSESAPAFSSVFMRSLSIRGCDPDRSRTQGRCLEEKRRAVLMRQIELGMAVEQIVSKQSDIEISEGRAGPQPDNVRRRIGNQLGIVGGRQRVIRHDIARRPALIFIVHADEGIVAQDGRG